MNKKILITTAILLCMCMCSYAQSSWQWGKRGGSPTASSGGGTDDVVVDMATDPNGNVYVLTTVYSPGVDIDGHSKPGHSTRDIVLASFSCDGSYRWSKLIGGDQIDDGVGVKTDTMGGVYITGYLSTSATALYIDADSSWTGGSRKTLFLAKFDTGGVYKWFRMPQADTVSGYSSANSAIYDIDVDGAGNIYWFVTIPPGAYAGGAYVVSSSPSVHMLKYNSSGSFVSGIVIDITYVGASPFFRMKRDHGNGRMYVTGQWGSTSGITMGTTPVTRALFIGAFNSSGTFLWYRQNTSTFAGGGFMKADVDADHNIYIAGNSNYFTINDTFNSYVVVNTINPYGTVPLVVKMDLNGNNIWARNGSANAATFCYSIIVNDTEAVVAGSYPSKFKWAGHPDSLEGAAGCLYSPYIVRFGAESGTILKMDSLESTCGYYTYASNLVAGKGGNFYLGGNFGSTLTVNGTTLSSAGGGSDFFVAKYGTPGCGCTMPVAGFSATGVFTVSFTYTGTAGYDSVRWNFGDGGTSTVANPTHTYAATGTYTVCVTVYNECGSNNYCQTVNVTVGINEVQQFSNVTIYPNPANEELVVNEIEAGTAIRLFSVMGRQVYTNVAVNSGIYTIPVSKLPPGNYVLQLTDTDGQTIRRQIVKN